MLAKFRQQHRAEQSAEHKEVQAVQAGLSGTFYLAKAIADRSCRLYKSQGSVVN